MIQAPKQVNFVEEALHTFTVFPDDLNYAGTLFGGKLLAEMDIAAVKAVRRKTYGLDCDGIVTAAVDRVDFLQPAQLGDIIDLKSRIAYTGTSSFVVCVEVTREDKFGLVSTICEASFTMVTLKNKKPFAHGL